MSNQEWSGAPPPPSPLNPYQHHPGGSYPRPPLTAPPPPFQPVPSFQPHLPTQQQPSFQPSQQQPQFVPRPPSSMITNNPPPVAVRPNPFAPQFTPQVPGGPPQFTSHVPPPRFGSPYAPPSVPPTQVPPPPPPVATYQAPGAYAQPGMTTSYQAPPPSTYPPQPLMYGTANLVEEFESLSMSSAPGSAEVMVESLPRPEDMEEEEQDPFWANCHPRFFELTTNAVPHSHSLAARWHLPLGAVVQPLADTPAGYEVPLVDFRTAGIIRCRRCRTYINPYSLFTDQGRYWRCTLCNLLNEVPNEYVCPLDEHGKRLDTMQRPELSQGSVDFVAPVEYMVRPPMPPSYFFLIDVSVYSVRSGMLQVAVDTIKSCLDMLPGFPRTRIGFLTFDSTLHFYNLKSSLTQAQMHVVAQLEDSFLPLPDDLLVNLSDSRAVVDSLLECLPSIHKETDNVESAFGPALQAAITLMGELGGKLLVFQSTLPSLGVGRLKLRGEDARIYQTDKEHTIRIAEDHFYKQMAAECSKAQIGVDMFTFSEKYTDIASLGTLAKYTGGQLYHYHAFDATVDAERLRYDLTRNLTRETVWEAVMRIRCGKGIKYNVFHGHFMLRSSDLCALPTVDSDKAFSVQFSLDETLLTDQISYFQIALLYTSSTGERRIRVHTAAVPVVQELQALYKAASMRAIVGVFSRLAVEKSLNDKLENARQVIHVKLVNALREFRNLHGVKHQLIGRMVYPDNLKLLPLYVLALCKSLPLRGGFMDATADERSAAGYEMMTMSLPRLMDLLYPTFVRLDAPQGLDNPKRLPLAQDQLDPQGAFLLADGKRIVIWLGSSVSPTFTASLFGPVDISNSRKFVLAETESKVSKELHSLVRSLRDKNPACYQPCLLVRQGESVREMQLLYSNLVEDRGSAFPSYSEWIVQIHRQVQQKM